MLRCTMRLIGNGGAGWQGPAQGEAKRVLVEHYCRAAGMVQSASGTGTPPGGDLGGACAACRRVGSAGATWRAAVWARGGRRCWRAGVLAPATRQRRALGVAGRKRVLAQWTRDVIFWVTMGVLSSVGLGARVRA